MRNITARKKAEAANAALEAQLRESQKMQALGTLAGGIAHDFNNTLATILGNAELAREDSLNNPPALESLEAILKAGARARNLVKQILAFSRRQPLERKRIDLAPVVQETAHLLRATLPARLGLDCYCVPGVPMVLADASQIEQVMINLVTNAMQAIPDGPGRIEIKLDTVVLDAGLVDTYPALHALSVAHPGNAVRLTVSDTGVGMALDTQKRLFEPFFTTKPIGAGTGLGLSVVHGIVQGHAGAIVVESEPGKGAIFTIYLPASAPLAMDHEPDGTRAPPTTSSEMRLCLMHIDDDPGILSFFQRYFERHACRISAYGDPRTALEVLSADPSAFDLVLTDYNMPDLSGLDVARRVRDIDVSLPVVVLSGFVDETLRAQAEACGIREILSKSDPVEVIYRVVQRIAQSNTSRSAASGK